MSEILDRLQTTPTGMRSIRSGRPCTLVSEIGIDTFATEAPSIDEYIMTGKLQTLFRCNRAQYQDAEYNARRMIARELYKDVHVAISALHAAAFSEDTTQMHMLLDELEEKIT
jgi:hypothetical protein